MHIGYDSHTTQNILQHAKSVLPAYLQTVNAQPSLQAPGQTAHCGQSLFSLKVPVHVVADMR